MVGIYTTATYTGLFGTKKFEYYYHQPSNGQQTRPPMKVRIEICLRVSSYLFRFENR